VRSYTSREGEGKHNVHRRARKQRFPRPSHWQQAMKNERDPGIPCSIPQIPSRCHATALLCSINKSHAASNKRAMLKHERPS
jgi:hypothetical protein